MHIIINFAEFIGSLIIFAGNDVEMKEKEIRLVIEKCYDTHFADPDRDWNSAEFLYAVSQTVEYVCFNLSHVSLIFLPRISYDSYYMCLLNIYPADRFHFLSSSFFDVQRNQQNAW